jgi:hypothetical protein
MQFAVAALQPGNDETVYAQPWAHESGSNQVRWRRLTWLEAVMKRHGLAMSRACKPRYSTARDAAQMSRYITGPGLATLDEPVIEKILKDLVVKARLFTRPCDPPITREAAPCDVRVMPT